MKICPYPHTTIRTFSGHSNCQYVCFDCDAKILNLGETFLCLVRSNEDPAIRGCIIVQCRTCHQANLHTGPKIASTLVCQGKSK